MTVTVQEAEVKFSAAGLPKIQSASAAAGKHLNKMASAARRAAGSVGKLASSGARLGGRYALGGLVAGATAAGGLLKLAADAETLNTQFAVLTGSAGEAEALMGRIDKFAASTPFQKMDIAGAARSLLAFGGSSDTVVDELRMLGDISAATGSPLGELSELYGKAKVQGRLFAEDMNQLTGRGIPVTQALAKEFGVAESEVRGLVEKGKVGFPELQRALAGMTAPGGKFSGMMEKLSGTTAGKFSTFVDNVKLLGTEIGEQLLPRANEFLEWATNAVQGVDGVGTAFGTVIDTATSWYQTVSGYLQDVGTVAGVIAADWSTLWSGLFTDLQSYAEAAFRYILDNSAIMIRNLINLAANAPGILEQTGRRLGEEAAYALGLSDEKLEIDPLAGVKLDALEGFQAPKRSAETASVMSDIEEELRLSRAARSGEMTTTDRAPQETSVPAGSQSFVSQDKTAAAQKAGKAASVDRGSALSVFNKLQDSLANKSLDVAKKQLDEQKMIAEATQQMALGFGNLAAGFVPVLG